jgi:hypothetical protein
LFKNLEINFKRFFTSEELNQLAKETQFVRRRSGKIDGKMFMDLIVFNNDCLKTQSLNDLSVILQERYNTQISKQSLHQRFNKYALAFLTKALASLLEKQFSTDYLVNKIPGIKRILLKDSVCFQVDKSLRDIYPGTSGNASEACVRIQFEYDLLNGGINDLSLSAYIEQDAKNSMETIEKTRSGDLIIRDLAYMKLDVLETLIGKTAFFLSRLDHKVQVYTKKSEGEYQVIDFLRITKHMRKNHLAVMDNEVYIGTEKKLKVRLIVHLLPNEVVSERIRRLKKKNKKKGRTNDFSPKYKARLALNLYVTNTSKQQIETANVWNFYRLRWQIELVFKTWKSFCKIDKVKKVQRYRLQCYIYSKLIFILIGWQILWRVAMLMEKHQKQLSLLKAFKTLTGTKLRHMREAFIKGNEKIDDFIMEFFNISIKKHLLEKKKNSPTSKHILDNVLSNGKKEKSQMASIDIESYKIA